MQQREHVMHVSIVAPFECTNITGKVWCYGKKQKWKKDQLYCPRMKGRSGDIHPTRVHASFLSVMKKQHCEVSYFYLK